MTAVFEIPLKPAPQQFGITIAGVSYIMRFLYCDAPEAGWIMDIGAADGTPILCGVPLVTGVDLLAQYAYLNFQGSLYVATSGDPDAVPTFDNLGVISHLYFVLAP